jgi:predicted nuclease of restriction endonuclease-like (RecB) superfamily
LAIKSASDHVRKLPWGHNRLLLDQADTPLIRLWYAHKAIEHGWSRAVLTHHIETQLHKREGKAVTNFQRTLPPPQSDLAEQTLKDPYNFDFLTIRSDAHERDLEQGLLDHIQKFLLELGVGFAFVGRQYHMEISGQDYYLDLLFYHLRLRCYVVIDLKMKAFEPEFAGKMNFYLSAVDDQLRHADDRPSIGLLLCKERDHLTVEYALRDLKKPIGVAQWQTKLVESLPKNLKGSLPTVAEIEAELDNARTKLISAIPRFHRAIQSEFLIFQLQHPTTLPKSPQLYLYLRRSPEQWQARCDSRHDDAAMRIAPRERRAKNNRSHHASNSNFAQNLTRNDQSPERFSF